MRKASKAHVVAQKPLTSVGKKGTSINGTNQRAFLKQGDNTVTAKPYDKPTGQPSQSATPLKATNIKGRGKIN